MKLLISLVGMRDPYGDDGSEGSILTAAGHLRPDRIHLLPNRGRTPAEGTEENARRTEAILRERLPHAEVRIHPLPLADPTDYGKINAVLGHGVRDALFGLTDAELHCAISSGTPQLRMMLMLLLQEQAGAVHFWETRAPRYVTAARPRVEEIDLSFLRRPAVGAAFGQAWRAADFAGVALLLREQVERQPLAPTAALITWAADVADAYARWDAVDWTEARTRLTAVLDRAQARTPAAPFRPVLERQVAVLDRLIAAQAAEREDYISMVDLYHNARRRLAARRSMDALARWRRTLEGALSAAIRSIDGCDITPGGEMTVTAGIEDKWREKRVAKWGEAAWPPVGSASLNDRLWVLDAVGRLPRRFTNAIGGAQEARNYSIAAHGMQPVVEPDKQGKTPVTSALNQIGELLAALFPDEAEREPVEDYPLSVAALDRLGGDLGRLLGPTP